MIEYAATLPKVRRRKPLPPGFKVALAQVLWCHLGFVLAVALYLAGDAPFWALAVWAMNVAMCWARHRWWMGPHSPTNPWACVHHLRRYWRQWRDE